MVGRTEPNAGTWDAASDSRYDANGAHLASTLIEEETSVPFRSWQVRLRVAAAVPQKSWVRALRAEVGLDRGQPAQVGISWQCDPEGVSDLVAMAGFRLSRQWFDARRWFTLNQLVPG